MNHEPEIIRARFVEAAFTERYLSPAIAPTCKGYWPEFIHDTSDKEGWDDAAHLDNASKRMGRASTGAISRHQECLDWTRTIIADEMRRHVLWSWAFCKANGWDFAARCSRKGWARPTAYRRLNTSIEAISDKLGMGSVLVRLPDDKWLRHETPEMASIAGKLAHEPERSAIPNKPYRTDRHADLIQTEQDAEQFGKWLSQRNEREARRRAKLGLDAA